MDSEYFDAAFKKLMEVADSQEKHWSELPKLLDRSAANFAVKANAAASDAVAAGVSPIKDLLEQQGHVLKGMRADISELTRASSFHERDLKALKKDLDELKKKVSAAETRITALEARGSPA